MALSYTQNPYPGGPKIYNFVRGLLDLNYEFSFPYRYVVMEKTIFGKLSNLTILALPSGPYKTNVIKFTIYVTLTEKIHHLFNLKMTTDVNQQVTKIFRNLCNVLAIQTFHLTIKKFRQSVRQA